MTTKSEENAQTIMERVHKHTQDEGGVFTLTTGSQGSAKTSVNLSFADYTILHHPTEKVFYSNCYNAPLQFPKIGNDKWTIMVKKDAGITFHHRGKKLKKIYPDVIEFDDFTDLYEKAVPGKVNAVFFGNRFEWMKFINYLRSVGEWTHLYIDELSEVCPANTSGDVYRSIRYMATNLKEARKCLMCIHTNTQATQDIDYRILTKVMINIFLPGARTSKHSRITQHAIDNLHVDKTNGNEAYVEYSGRFGKVRFRKIYKPDARYNWEARVNGEI